MGEIRVRTESVGLSSPRQKVVREAPVLSPLDPSRATAATLFHGTVTHKLSTAQATDSQAPLPYIPTV